MDIYASRDINDLINMLAEALLLKFPYCTGKGGRSPSHNHTGFSDKARYWNLCQCKEDQ